MKTKTTVLMLLMLVTSFTTIQGADLFAEDIPAKSVQVIETTVGAPQTGQSADMSAAKSTGGISTRYASLNIYNAVIYGDFQLNYEMPAEGQFPTVFQAHLNPHGKQNKPTGTLGVMAGKRYYFDGKEQSYFAQALGGINLEEGSKWGLTGQIGGGKLVDWKKDVQGEIGAAMAFPILHNNAETLFLIYGNIKLTLKKPLLPFL